MAAVTASGTTVIDNAAREPEIVDICTMLTAMGAILDGIGTSTITIDGVDELVAVEHTTVGDRIVAGTWAIAATMTQGDIIVRRANAEHLTIALDKLRNPHQKFGWWWIPAAWRARVIRNNSEKTLIKKIQQFH